MQSYENIVVIKPQLSDEQVVELLDKAKKLITDNGGEILVEDKWGRRKLAFPIDKAREGYYAYTKFKAPAPTIEKLSRHFRVLDTILRVTTFRAHVTKEAPKKKAATVPVPPAPAQP